jgi:hypothetical protein
MSTVNIQVRTPKSYLEFNKSGQQKQENVVKLINLLSGYASGALDSGEIYVSGSSTSTLVAAAATATLTYANLANSVDTWVGYGVTITCVTGTPAASDATTGQFKKQTDATVSATNLVTTINAHPTLLKYVFASSSAGVVTITSNTKGTVGNFLTTHTSAGTGIADAAYSGGLGGAELAPVQVR